MSSRIRIPSTRRAARPMVSLGIPTLDERLGGIPANSVILVLGDPGSGFITFLQQILAARSKSGSKVIYVTLDRPQSDIISGTEVYGWEDAAKSWEYVDFSPWAMRKAQGQGMAWHGDTVNFLSHQLVKKIKESKEKGRLEMGAIVKLDTAIDSLTNILLSSDVKSVLDFITEYQTQIRDSQGLHFMTLVRGVHSEATENLLSHNADVVFEFTTIKGEMAYERVMGVKKMAGIPAPPSELFPLEFTDRGILPITTRRVA